MPTGSWFEVTSSCEVGQIGASPLAPIRAATSAASSCRTGVALSAMIFSAAASDPSRGLVPALDRQRHPIERHVRFRHERKRFAIRENLVPLAINLSPAHHRLRRIFVARHRRHRCHHVIATRVHRLLEECSHLLRQLVAHVARHGEAQRALRIGHDQVRHGPAAVRGERHPAINQRQPLRSHRRAPCFGPFPEALEYRLCHRLPPCLRLTRRQPRDCLRRLGWSNPAAFHHPRRGYRKRAHLHAVRAQARYWCAGTGATPPHKRAYHQYGHREPKA